MRMIHAYIITLGVLLVFTTLAVPSAHAQREIMIKALVDGPSDFIVTTNGFRWKNGANAKPGRHEGQNEPTFINDEAWYPTWESQLEDRGVDYSDLFAYALPSLGLKFELLAVGEDAEATMVEPRSVPTVSYGSDSMVINIPDPEPGSRWYVFALTYVDATLE